MRLALVRVLLYGTLALLSGCLGMPDQIRPVENFEVARYLGQWYEVARLDHTFERGLEQVTATYSRRDDGGIRVINRGYSAPEAAWREAEGKAYLVDAATSAYFKVSFFGPFYSSYVVFELDNDYQYAFVTGHNTDYLWLLARTPSVDPLLMDRFQRRAQSLGFDTKQLIYPQRAP